MWTWCVAFLSCATLGLWAVRQIQNVPEAAQVFRRELQLSPSQARHFIQPGDKPPPGFRVIPVAEQRLLAKAARDKEREEGYDDMSEGGGRGGAGAGVAMQLIQSSSSSAASDSSSAASGARRRGSG